MTGDDDVYRTIAGEDEQACRFLATSEHPEKIEALPGKHPVMEDFKLAHRALDVKKVQADVRSQELENLRRAARVLGGDLTDPRVDKNITITGGNPAVAVDPEA